ncbi:lactose-binding lectin l-2-like [Littorina saxatilis]|uniref:C-type lectin domain-containing protein n=1 Tax=Littorina saxatilis TaxID=31220 RepID=A0AAN9ATW3_9CAEN
MLYLSSVVLVAVWTSLFCFTPVQGSCPAGWEHHDESCYEFVTKEQTWINAEVDCIRHGARLAKIQSDDENEFLREYLSNNSRQYNGYDMWLGAKKRSDGGWGWGDGSTLADDDYDDWQTGNPDNPDLGVCLEFESGFNNHWNDDFCDELNYYICQRPFHPLTPPPPPTELIG